MQNILITGGLGYIGTTLTMQLINASHRVTVVDCQLHGRPVMHLHDFSSYLGGFLFIPADVRQPDIVDRIMDRVKPDVVIHLAALVGYPVCRRVGRITSYNYNIGGTEYVFTAANKHGVKQFIFASTYSVYGLSKDGGLIAETSPLNPQSIYAETKIASEEYLISQFSDGATCAPIILRFATLFGASPRMRLDLIINQFLWQAANEGGLIIYEPDFTRSFLHVSDAARAIRMAIDAPLETVGGETFNVGSEDGNLTKREVVSLVCSLIDNVEVEYKQLSVDGDMRNIAVSYEKIRRELEFYPEVSIAAGAREVLNVVRPGFLPDPTSDRYRNNKDLMGEW
jgi:nucleoside-diphosphate-sugar epimerase